MECRDNRVASSTFAGVIADIAVVHCIAVRSLAFVISRASIWRDCRRGSVLGLGAMDDYGRPDRWDCGYMPSIRVHAIREGNPWTMRI